jgi:hypothetical protein
MQVTLPNLKEILAKKHSLTLQIIEGTAPSNILEFASKGLLPIPRYEILEILVYLIINDSPYKDNALKTLAQSKPDDLIDILKRPDLIPEAYTYFAEAQKKNKKLLQALLYNRSVPNSVFEIIAESGVEDLLDIIVTNQIRLLNCPPIIDKLLRNANLSSDQKRRLVEFREEFFEKVSVGNPLFKGFQREVEKEALPPEEVDLEAVLEEAIKKAELEMQQMPTIGDVVSGIKKEKEAQAKQIADHEEAEDVELGADFVEPPEEIFNDDERKSKKVISAYNKIMKLNIPDRIKLAILGTREERSILIRDSNKQVSQAVLKSPKLTASDAQLISTFRQVDSDVLQGIANNKKWIKDYSIILNLVKNPKTPQGTALHLLNRVTITDMKILKANKNVPEIVRRTAQRLIIERSQRAG